MEAIAEFVSPLSGVIALVALFSVSAAIATGRSRRRRWARETREMERAGDRDQWEHIRRVRTAQRASDFMSDAIRKLYYLVTILSAVGLIALPLLSLEENTRRLAQTGLAATTFLGALALLAYWRGSDDDRESLLRSKLRQAQEREHARRGLAVRDELTGAYTLDFWLHALELRTRRLIWKQIPMTCVMLDVEGLPELRARRGAAAADTVLVQVSEEIQRNVRQRDLVARYRGQRFVVSLHKCPAKFSTLVAERIASNVEGLILRGSNKQHQSNLHLQWGSTSMPQDASTPIQLLRVTETTLDLKRSLIPAVARSKATAADQQA
ncbi:MAG: diguanylate cyclase [Anaerolineales bacterium]